MLARIGAAWSEGWSLRLAPAAPPWKPPTDGFRPHFRLAQLVKHAWHFWPMLAVSHWIRRLFGSMVRPIAALAALTGSGAAGKLLEIGHSRVLLYPEKPELAPPGLADSLGMREMRGTAPKEAVGCTMANCR